MIKITDNPFVSIVIRTFNGLEYLNALYETIQSHTLYKNFELMVADNGSHLSTQKYIMETIQPDLYLRNKTNLGAPVITDQCVKLAKGKFIAVLDNDILLPKGWLIALLDELLTNKAQLISPRRFKHVKYPGTNKPLKLYWKQVKKKNLSLPPKELFLTYTHGKDVNSFLYELKESSQLQSQTLSCPPDAVGSSCLLFDKDFVNNIGGWLETNYAVYGGDDIDLCWRIGLHGGKVIRSGKTFIHHFEHGSVEENNIKFEKLASQNNDLLFYKWKDQLNHYINQRKANGISLGTLKRYWLINKFISSPYYIDE